MSAKRKIFNGVVFAGAAINIVVIVAILWFYVF